MKENTVVTLFRPDRASGRLMCMGTVPAWVHQKHMLRNEVAATFNDDRFDVRIRLECLPDVRTGDLVFFGRAESACVKPSECRRIQTLTKNQCGTAPHWHLAAEYIYR